MTARFNLCQSLGRCLVLACLMRLASVPCNAQTRLILGSGGNISTLAGSGHDGRSTTGTASTVNLGSPRGLVYDSAGNLYVADTRNHQIDRISPTGALTIFGGTGSQGVAGDGGLVTTADLNEPTALALGTDSALLVADTGNHRIRQIDSAGIITTVAGNGIPGFAGDGGAATAARLRAPSGLAFGPDGTLYIADTGNHRIRKLTADGHLTTVAGTGTEDDTGDGGPANAATLRSPGALQMLPDGRLLIADRSAHRIRALSPDGTITAYATASSLRSPEGLGVDAAGNLLIADAVGQQVLQSGPDASAKASASALAGTGSQGAVISGSGGQTDLDSPAAVALSTSGDIVISDRRNHQVQRVALPSLAFGNIPAGKSSAAQILTLENGAAAELSVASAAFPPAFAIIANGTTCPALPFTLKPATTCALAIAFAPSVQGPQTGYAQVRASGIPVAAVLLTGTGSAPNGLTSSVTTLQSNGGISYVGSPVLLTAAVTGALQTAPVGNVTFYDGTTPVATVALSNGFSTLTTASMQQGQHTIHAEYSGDALYSASSSAGITQTVVPAPDFSVAMTAATYAGKAGGTITIPFSIAPANGTLNHTMQLTVGGLPTGFVATVTPSVFTIGANPTNVAIEIRIPAVLSFSPARSSRLVFASLLIGITFVSGRKRLKNKPGYFLLLLTALSALASGGCGGGFRATTNDSGSGTNAGPKSFQYTAVITATTTGVLGDTLTHSANIGLVVTP